MSMLTLFRETDPENILEQIRDPNLIGERLATFGIRFERWPTRSVEASSEAVLEAYQTEIEKLKAENGFTTADVISLGPDHPQKDELRKKFLDEHRHSEDEIRFFVRGHGLFYLHIDGRVLVTLCEEKDLISVPAGTPHWFDMGPKPDFTAIRMFTNPEGWVAEFTGSDIAVRFPRYESIMNTLNPETA